MAKQKLYFPHLYCHHLSTLFFPILYQDSYLTYNRMPNFQMFYYLFFPMLSCVYLKLVKYIIIDNRRITKNYLSLLITIVYKSIVLYIIFFNISTLFIMYFNYSFVFSSLPFRHLDHYFPMRSLKCLFANLLQAF